uniref:RING-type domain-containing protein n=1 Tax=Arion vulgaris TaxID=1028688 RepID=A0A0B7BEB1_9EUPU
MCLKTVDNCWIQLGKEMCNYSNLESCSSSNISTLNIIFMWKFIIDLAKANYYKRLIYKEYEIKNIINGLSKINAKRQISNGFFCPFDNVKLQVNGNKCPEDENISTCDLYYNHESEENNQRHENQDSLNKKEVQSEDESMNTPPNADEEILKAMNSELLRSSKFTVTENDPKQTSSSQFVDAVKQSLIMIKVSKCKQVFSIERSVKYREMFDKTGCKDDSGDCDGEENLVEQLFMHQNFRIKIPIAQIYMILNMRSHPPEIFGISWNKLNEERWRLYTYAQYPHNAKKSAILLAHAGFAYIGTGNGIDDRVICSFCCVEKQNWLVSEIILETHKNLSPDCSMITGESCNNVPMIAPNNGETLFKHFYNLIETKTNVDNKQQDNKQHTNMNQGNMNDIDCDNSHSNHSAEDRHAVPSLPTKHSRNAVSTQVSKPFPEANPIVMGSHVSQFSVQEPVNLTSANSTALSSDLPSSSMASNSASYNFIPNRIAAHYGDRSNTSTADTPTASTANTPTASTATTIAQTSSLNRQVVNQATSSSASSNVTISNHHHSTRVDTETNSPEISNTNQSNNPPQENSQTATANTQNANKATGQGPTYGELGIITERPKRFEYAVRATRYTSFEPWPRDHHLKKGDLADAGFYYAGYGDCARCFYCGGGLRNWEKDDNVLIEHARWFPKCAYMRQTMGQQFVDAVQDLNKSFDRITYSMVTDKMGSSAASFQLDTKNVPLKRDPAVLTVLDIGYLEKDVIEAANFVKEKYGTLSADKVFEKLKHDKKPRTSNGASVNSQTSEYSSDAPKDKMSMNKLKEENSQLRQQTVCKICMDKEVAVVFLPCGHFVSCSDCAAAMKDCPVCRKEVRGVVRAFVG